jgi:polyisoprenoid-binding protein YceI
MLRHLARLTTLLLLPLATAAPALAAPAAYVLEPAESVVGFETRFGPDLITGQMPVTAADLVLDFDTVSNCQIDVTLDVSGAEASFPFAAQAMKGPKVLDSAAFPEISFRSSRVTRQGEGARVEGDLTIRGVTRPVTLDAMIWRQKGTEPGDLRQLTVQLTGAVLRSDYGATGWLDMVGDEVRLTILARIARVD